MGVNFGALAQSLGLGGHQDPNQNNYGVPSAVPQPGMGPRALLGPQEVDPDIPQSPSQMAPIDDPNTIVAQGSAPPRMSPETLGMPGLQQTRLPNPDQIAELRQQLRDKAEMARQIYHPNSEFGTHGVLRDIVGNVSDVGRRLLGFAPRYNEEKWTERAYGMSSSNPEVAAAAREQAMQYNAGRTMDYGKDLVSEAATKANSDATNEYKNAQTQSRSANIVSGLGSALLSSNLGAGPEQAQANYDRMRGAIQANLDKTYGPGVMEAPAEYSDGFARQLAQSGYTGSNVQRAQSNVLTEQNKREIATMGDATKRAIASASNDTRIRVAGIMAQSGLTRDQMKLEVARELGLAPTTVVEEESGSIVQPTKTRTTTRGGASASPRKFMNGHWYVRGPNGEAVLDD